MLECGIPASGWLHMEHEGVGGVFLLKCVRFSPDGNVTLTRFLLLVRRCGCGIFFASYSIGIMSSIRDASVPKANEQMKYHQNTSILPMPGMNATVFPKYKGPSTNNQMKM